MPKENKKQKPQDDKAFIREIKLTSFFDKMPAEFRAKIKEVFPDIPTIKIVRIPNIFEIKELNEGKRRMTAYASTRRLDHDGDIVVPSVQFGCKGCNTELYKMNPIVLFAHDYSSLPIAKSIETTPDSYGVLSLIEFAETERGEETWQLVKGGFLNTLSAGFVADKVSYREDDDFTKLCDQFQAGWPEFKGCDRDKVRRIVKDWTLFEKSLVPVPSNPYALVQDVAKGKIKLSEEMFKRLDLDKYKGEPTEPIPAEPTEPEIKIIPATPLMLRQISQIRQINNIKQTLTESALADIAGSILEKSIDRRRGLIG